MRPFVQTNQHDQADPRVRLCRPEGKQAIAEAVQRAQMRFVPIKSAAQLDLPALHRARDRLVTQRTGLIDRIRAFLRERGIALQPGRLARARAWPEMLGAAAELSPPMGARLARLRVHGPALDDEIAALDQHSPIIARTHPGARLLMIIPGIGALIAPARSAASDGGQAFGRGRDRACWLGLVPRQHATGGKARRRGIAQRGNGYPRRLLVHAARFAQARRQDPGRPPRRLAARPGSQGPSDRRDRGARGQARPLVLGGAGQEPAVAAGQRLSPRGCARRDELFCKAEARWPQPSCGVARA